MSDNSRPYRYDVRERGHSPFALYELSKLALISIELIGYRFRRSGVGTLIAIAEPIAVVSAFTYIQQLIIKQPPFGTSIALFYLTGILPFYLFFHTTLRFRLWDTTPRYPQISEVEIVISQLLSELIGKILIIVICCTALYWYGVPDAVPVDPLKCLEALLLLSIMGAAMGIINAVVSTYFPPWYYVYQITIRGWMAFSGVLLLVDRMPKPLREAAVWIPVTHAVTLYRTGQYQTFPSMSLDMSYLLKTVVGLVVLSILLENGTRRWRVFP